MPNFGYKRIRTILNHIKSLEEFFKLKQKDFLQIPGINEKLVRQINREDALRKAESYANYLIKHNHTSHFYLDNSFPKKLNQCEDAPLLLFTKGNVDLNQSKTVAIVGTRNATSYGKQICEDLINAFQQKNILVVSGLAYGIDIHVHQLCVRNGIPTLGVLGHGLDSLYPSTHKKTAKEMLENGGLLTEFLPGTKPDRENFPMRNRIVAGMCDATIVVESGEKGGSLITAELANDYNRDVFAFPGDITREYSKGCNKLIQENKAHLITSAQQFLNNMSWNQENQAKQLDLFTSLSADEKTIVSCFKEKLELSFDNLICLTKFSFSELSSLLLNLEFSGLIKPFPGKFYRLSS
jgi:DNA processing protein